MHSLTVQAISAALSHQWDLAITLNQKILQETPHDYDALNRLAYAFLELGRIDEAQEMFQRVLELDPKNFIATKNLLKILKMQQGFPTNQPDEPEKAAYQIQPDLFVEEPGKTKESNLVRIAAKDTLSSLRVGYRVELHPKSRSIGVYFGKDTCIGYLPDDLSFTLARFIEAGNQYEAYIKTISPTLVTVFLKETHKSPEYGNLPSFMDTRKLTHSHYVMKHVSEPRVSQDDTEYAADFEPNPAEDSFDQDQ